MTLVRVSEAGVLQFVIDMTMAQRAMLKLKSCGLDARFSNFTLRTIKNTYQGLQPGGTAAAGASWTVVSQGVLLEDPNTAMGLWVVTRFKPKMNRRKRFHFEGTSAGDEIVHIPAPDDEWQITMARKRQL